MRERRQLTTHSVRNGQKCLTFILQEPSEWDLYSRMFHYFVELLYKSSTKWWQTSWHKDQVLRRIIPFCYSKWQRFRWLGSIFRVISCFVSWNDRKIHNGFFKRWKKFLLQNFYEINSKKDKGSKCNFWIFAPKYLFFGNCIISNTVQCTVHDIRISLFYCLISISA